MLIVLILFTNIFLSVTKTLTSLQERDHPYIPDEYLRPSEFNSDEVPESIMQAPPPLNIRNPLNEHLLKIQSMRAGIVLAQGKTAFHDHFKTLTEWYNEVRRQLRDNLAQLEKQKSDIEFLDKTTSDLLSSNRNDNLTALLNDTAVSEEGNVIDPSSFELVGLQDDEEASGEEISMGSGSGESDASL